MKDRHFSADNRRSLLELLRPPEGYRLHRAIGTAYSLDFVTLTAAMLAFVDAEAESPDVRQNTVDILQALIRLGKRLRVFVNRGYIQHNRQSESSPIFQLFDRIICEVRFDQGSFHPKIWVLQFMPKAQPELVKAPLVTRFVCSSRNLTAINYWELAVCLDGRPSGRSGELGRQLRGFLDRLHGELSPDEQTIFTDLLDNLDRVKFELPREMRDGCKFAWQWPGVQKLAPVVKGHGSKALIMAPFITKTFVADIVKRFGRVTLISTRRALDQLDDELFHILKQHKLYAIQSDIVDGSAAALELHAKLYILEQNGSRKMLLGSANASPRAWQGLNCEAMLDFAPSIPISRFFAQFAEDKKGQLFPWVREYTEEDRKLRPEDTEEEVAQQTLNEIHEEVSQLVVLATLDRRDHILRLSARDSTSLQHNFEDWFDKATIRVCPLSLLNNAGQNEYDCLKPLSDLFDDGIEFHKVGRSQLTEFVFIEIAHKESTVTKRFVIKAVTDFGDLLESRDTELLKSLLTPDQFQTLLSAILFDGAARSRIRPPRVPGNGNSGTRKRRGWIGAGASIEDVLRSCTEDTSRIEELNHVLEQFASTEYVDEDLMRFWTEFLAAWETVRGAD